MPFIDVRRDFQQARHFEHQIKPYQGVYDRLTGVFVVNVEEKIPDEKAYRAEKEQEILEDGETDISIAVTRLEPSDRDPLQKGANGLGHLMGD